MTDQENRDDLPDDKPEKRLLQVDGFCRVLSDDVMHPDDNGDAIMLGITHERMRSPSRDMPVRVFVHEDADREDVRRLLGKMLDEFDRCFDFLREENERELFARADVPFEELPF